MSTCCGGKPPLLCIPQVALVILGWRHIPSMPVRYRRTYAGILMSSEEQTNAPEAHAGCFMALITLSGPWFLNVLPFFRYSAPASIYCSWVSFGTHFVLIAPEAFVLVWIVYSRPALIGRQLFVTNRSLESDLYSKLNVAKGYVMSVSATQFLFHLHFWYGTAGG